MKDNYPVTAGFKSLGAAEIAARVVDRDPERLMKTFMNIAAVTLLSTPLVADEIAVLIDEGPLYVRPRITRLIQLGIVQQGPMRIASICGRAAHVIEPSSDLLALIQTRGIQLDGSDDDALWNAIGSLMTSRIESEKRRKAKETVEATGPLKAPRSDRRAG